MNQMSGWADYFPIVRDRVRKREFSSLFLFVTSRCNAKCRTCFYHDKLNSRDDLTLEQILRISATAPRFRKLWISGGEPFLRPDLGDILVAFANRNGVANINLPTNGLQIAPVFETLDRVLSETSAVVDLNFSLDGFADTHDRIRRVPGNYARAMETFRAVSARYDSSRVRRNFVSVVTSANVYELPSLARHLLASENADGHYFEPVRGEVPDSAVKALSLAALEGLHREIQPVYAAYAKRLFARLGAPARQVATVYYLGNLALHSDIHERCFERPARWPMRCTAGETSLVIDHNGKFRACELRGCVGDLHAFDFDVKAALQSVATEQEIEAIQRDGCWCTHSCFIQDSSKFSALVQLWMLPVAGVQQWLR